MKENRIYVDGTLVNCCCSEYSFMSNLTNYRQKYGERVTIKKFEKMIMDDEKREWLDKL